MEKQMSNRTRDGSTRKRQQEILEILDMVKEINQRV
jgi:hypothetical protein